MLKIETKGSSGSNQGDTSQHIYLKVFQLKYSNKFKYYFLIIMLLMFIKNKEPDHLNPKYTQNRTIPCSFIIKKTKKNIPINHKHK